MWMLEERSATLQAISGSSGKASFGANGVRVENGIADVKRRYSRRSVPAVCAAVLPLS